MSGATRILIITSFFTLGMGSCSTSVEEACRDQLPALQQQFDQITHEVAEYAPPHANRAIASLSSDDTPTQDQITQLNAVVDLKRDQKDQWQNWSEKRLVQVEQYLDYVRTRNQYRAAITPLSGLANELVKFDGYIDQGKAYQAMAALQRAREDADSVIHIACH